MKKTPVVSLGLLLLIALGTSAWCKEKSQKPPEKSMQREVPLTFFRDSPAERLPSFLLRYGFFEEDIKTFSMNNGCFSGTNHGVDFTICGIEHLPKIHGHVVLSVDADFFPAFSASYDLSSLSAVKFYEERGFGRYAEELRENPKLQHPFE